MHRCCLRCPPRSRSIWAVVQGGLREYDLDGNLRRKIARGRLERHGVKGLTSVAQYKGRKLLLGMKRSNTVAIVDTAPPSVHASITASISADVALTNLSFTRSNAVLGEDLGSINGISRLSANEGFGHGIEPPGKTFEDEVIESLNPLVVERVISLPSLRPSSLGPISYSSAEDRIIYAASTSGRSSRKRLLYQDIGEKLNEDHV